MRDSFRQTVRAAIARPLHAALVVASIAAGLSANAIVFGVIDAAILRPFPFAEPERLVGIGAAYPRLNRSLEFFESLSGPEYVAIRERASAFAHTTGFDLGNEPVMIDESPERVFTAYFWDDPFTVLGIQPSAGRPFTSEELRTGAPVAVITERFARTLPNTSGAALVGRAMRVGGRPHTIVGIVPARVDVYGTDLWVPMRESPGTLPQNRRQFNAIARLAAGQSIDAANAALERTARTIASEHETAHPEYREFRLEGRPWTEIHVWGFRRIASISFGAVGLLMLLIVANLANVLLGSASERAREMAVRAALGASRRTLALQVLTETFVLVAAGAVVGLLLAWMGLRGTTTLLQDFLPPGTVLSMNAPVVALVVAMSLLAGLLVSVAPVLQLSRTQPATVLATETGRASGSRGARRLQRALVAVQVAIAVIVTGSAALLATTVGRVLAIDAGFPMDDVMAMRITLPLPKYDGPRAMAFFDALLERVRVLPAVAEASVSNQPPPGVFSRAQFEIEGAPPSDRLPSAFFTTAGPRYAETLGLQLTRGRWFDERALREGPREVVVNEAFAERLFPGENAVGRRLLITPPHADKRPTEIVGIVQDVRNRGLLPDPSPEIIGSFRQIPDRRQSQLYLVVRGRSGTASLLSDVRGVIRGIDPEQPVYAVSTLRALYESGVSARRTAAMLLGMFGGLAIALASLGIYGVVSRSVQSRRQEIGIRAALGAQRGALQRLVVADAMQPLVAGVLIGVGFILAGRATLASWIYGVTPEIAPLALTIAVLTVVGLAASSLPAWRASRIDPLSAITGRQES